MQNVLNAFRIKAIISGDNSKEDTPVPIPNTEVKLFSANDTWWVTAWESKTSPDIFFNIQENDILKNYCCNCLAKAKIGYK